MLSVTVDIKPVTLAITKLARRTPVEAKRAIGLIIGDIQRVVTRERMSGRPGLNRLTGSLVLGLMTDVKGTKIADLVGRVGWQTARGAMIARVHELGTVGKGGLLPDIVPKRKPFLAWPLRDPSRAKGKVIGWAFARKVSIPARLEFFRTAHGPSVAAAIKKRLDDASGKAVK